MPRGRKSPQEPLPPKRGRPKSPEKRENEVIALAYDLAERQIRDGTASAQVITHFLKLGSQKEQLEREIMKEQRKLVSAKTKSIESGDRLETMFQDAMKAFSTYSGNGEDGSDDEDS